MSQNEELEIILKFVKEYRSKRNIVPTVGYKPEGSGEMYGEGYMLLFRQLIYTPEGTGGWLELDDPKIRSLVIREIENFGQKEVDR